MATYFPERRQVDSFEIPLDAGRSLITCTIFEHWEDTDNTTTARCGDPGTIEVKKTVGLTKRDEHTLKSTIGGTIGPEAIAQLKSQIEVSVKKEVCFHLEESVTKTSTFTSDKCGRKTMFVYQKVREYEFSYSSRKWGFTKSWERKIREKTNVHDFMPDIDNFDETCKCTRPPKPDYFDGLVVIDMDTVSIRAPYKKVPNGIEIRVDTSVLKISIIDSEDFLVRIPIAALPEIVVFLGELEGDSVEAAFYEYKPIAQHRPLTFNAGVSMEPIASVTPAIEILQEQYKNEEQI